MKGVQVARMYCGLSATKKASMTLYSLEVHLAVAGCLEMVVMNLGLYPHHQSDILIQLEVCHHPVKQLHQL